MDISRDGRYIVSGGGDRTVRMWDLDSGQNSITLSIEDGVTCVAISPKGNLIAAGSLDRGLRVWDALTGYLIKRIEGHTDSIYSIAFALHSEHLISASLDKTIRLWRLKEEIQPSVSNTTHADCVRTFEGHKVLLVSIYTSCGVLTAFPVRFYSAYNGN